MRFELILQQTFDIDLPRMNRPGTVSVFYDTHSSKIPYVCTYCTDLFFSYIYGNVNHDHFCFFVISTCLRIFLIKMYLCIKGSYLIVSSINEALVIFLIYLLVKEKRLKQNAGNIYWKKGALIINKSLRKLRRGWLIHFLSRLFRSA